MTMWPPYHIAPTGQPFWPAPPPPPPPRKPTSPQEGAAQSATPPQPASEAPASNASRFSSRRQSSHDGESEFSLQEERPGMGTGPEPAMFNQASIQVSHLSPELQTVLNQIMYELGRVEMEGQAAHRNLSADMSRMRKEREAAWKHVSELKEQNRLLRQRNYELEVQNGHLNRHIMLLQEQLTLFAEQRKAFETLAQASSAAAAVNHNVFLSRDNTAASAAASLLLQQLGGSATAAALSAVPSLNAGGGLTGISTAPLSHAAGVIGDKKVPRLPHSGADIW